MALIGLDSINPGIFGIGFSKADAYEVQVKIDEAQDALEKLTDFSGKEDLESRLADVQNDLTEQVNNRYVTYEILEDKTNSEKLTFKVSANYFKAGNVNYLTNNKRLTLQKKDDHTIEAYYVNFSWNTPEAGDKWKTSLRFNGGVRTMGVEITNNGDGTWDIDGDWLIKKD